MRGEAEESKAGDQRGADESNPKQGGRAARMWVHE
jgi:hypothetical protein